MARNPFARGAPVGRQGILALAAAMLLAVGGARGQAPDKDWVVLDTLSNPGEVKLKWAPAMWPTNLVGFDVKRRRIEPGGARALWMNLNRAPIRPEIDPNRDFSLVESDRRQQRMLQDWVAAQVDENKLAARPADALRNDLAEQPELLLDFATSIRNTWEFPLVAGFGYVDRNLPAPGAYEYGLFPVWMDRTADEPACTVLLNVNSVDPAWVRLYAELRNGQARILWLPSQWRADVAGFNLKRRRPGQGWENLNRKLLIPGMPEKRDWTNLGVSPAEGDRLEKKMWDMVVAGGVMEQRIPPEQMREWLNNAYDRELGGFRIHSRLDFDKALIFGWAFVDAQADAKAEEVWEYALFPVNDEGQEDERPCAVTKVQPLDPLRAEYGVSLQVDRWPMGTNLRWTVPRVRYHELGILGFKVYRHRPGAGPWSELSPHLVPESVETETDMEWQYMDPVAADGMRWEYGVAPVTVFQTEMKRSMATYHPGKTRSERLLQLDYPVIESLNTDESNNVVVTWSCSTNFDDLLDGFRVTRADGTAGVKRVISELLPVTARQYVDATEKTLDMGYEYQVETRVKEITVRGWSSDPEYLIFTDNRKPPTPTGLQVQWVPNDGDGYILLTWDPKRADDDLTQGYYLYSDFLKTGAVIMANSQEMIATNRYEYRVGGRAGRPYRVGVAAKSVRDVMGAVAEGHCYVPAQSIVSVADDFTLVPLAGDPSRIVLSWEYDHPELEELAGFRIYEGDATMAREPEIGPAVRQWTSPPLAPNRLFAFSITAASSNGLESTKAAYREYYYLDPDAFGAAGAGTPPMGSEPRRNP